jgi:hypothetical protein
LGASIKGGNNVAGKLRWGAEKKQTDRVLMMRQWEGMAKQKDKT